MKKEHFYIWFASVAILIIDLLAYCEFIMGRKTVTKMIIDLIMLGVGVALQFYARKKLTYKEGYTAIQALWFYMKCKKAGITTQKDIFNNMEKITEFAKSSGIKVQGKPEQYHALLKNGSSCYKLIKNNS